MTLRFPARLASRKSMSTLSTERLPQGSTKQPRARRRKQPRKQRKRKRRRPRSSSTGGAGPPTLVRLPDGTRLLEYALRSSGSFFPTWTPLIPLAPRTFLALGIVVPAYARSQQPVSREQAIESAVTRGARAAVARADTLVGAAQLLTARSWDNPSV